MQGSQNAKIAKLCSRSGNEVFSVYIEKFYKVHNLVSDAEFMF